MNAIIDITKDGKVEGKKLSIIPEGGVDPFEFQTGSWCGAAKDSVGIRWTVDRHPSLGGGRMTVGAVMTHDDVKSLRELLQWAEANWSDDPQWEV